MITRARAALSVAVALLDMQAPSALARVDADRARQSYVLQCQGCHGPNGDGAAHATPAILGSVARFVHNSEGRAYLIRVPGVTAATLSDQEVADLMTWLLAHFDPGHLPSSFVPYSAAEIGSARGSVLRADIQQTRRRILGELAHDPR